MPLPAGQLSLRQSGPARTGQPGPPEVSRLHQLVFPAQLQSEQDGVPHCGSPCEALRWEKGAGSPPRNRRRAGTGIKALVSVSLCWEGLPREQTPEPGSLGVIVLGFAVVAFCCFFFFCLKFGSVVCFPCKDAYQRGIVNFRVSLFCPLNVQSSQGHCCRGAIPASASYSLNQGLPG